MNQDVTSKLELLHYLKEQGILSNKQYEQQRNRLLGVTPPPVEFANNPNTVSAEGTPSLTVVESNSNRSLTIIALMLLAIALLVVLGKKDNESTAPMTTGLESVSSDSSLSNPKSSAELAAEAARLKKQQARELAEERAFLKTRAGRIYKRHPEWSKDDCISLSKGNIWVGMSYEMLKYRRGLPNHANPSNYGNGTQWQWCWDDYTPSCFYDKDDDGLVDSYN